jgi:hypothetical protein
MLTCDLKAEEPSRSRYFKPEEKPATDVPSPRKELPTTSEHVFNKPEEPVRKPRRKTIIVYGKQTRPPWEDYGKRSVHQDTSVAHRRRKVSHKLTPSDVSMLPLNNLDHHLKKTPRGNHREKILEVLKDSNAKFLNDLPASRKTFLRQTQ